MGNKGILVGIIIAGIAVMLALSSIPVYADHSWGHDGKCPGKWVSQDVTVGDLTDANLNGVVCFKILGHGQIVFRDDVLHPNNP